MEKIIIATTLSGLFIKHEPWDKAHILWFKKASEQLKDASVNNWATRPDYFKGVDEVMKRLYTQLSDDDRTRKARELFFDSVCEYAKINPQVRNDEIIKYFSSLKERYKIALITTNIQSALERIIQVIGISGFFDIVETSLPEEKDDKRIVFDRFIKKYGKPIVYIGGSRKDSFDYCKENNIPCLFTNFEKEQEIDGVESVHNIEELKAKLKQYNIN